MKTTFGIVMTFMLQATLFGVLLVVQSPEATASMGFSKQKIIVEEEPEFFEDKKAPAKSTHRGTVERGKPCIIMLVAPKDKGHCELAANDPAAKVTVKGWYTVHKWTPPGKEETDLAELVTRINKDPEPFASDVEMLGGNPDDPIDFWNAREVVDAVPELDPEQGTSLKWPDPATTGRAVSVYSLPELKEAAKALVDWAIAFRKANR